LNIGYYAIVSLKNTNYMKKFYRRIALSGSENLEEGLY